MARREDRIRKLEQQAKDNAVRFVVNWDENPEPPPPGTLVVTWDEVMPERKSDNENS